LGQVRRVPEAFAVGGVEAEGYGKSAFAEGGVDGEGEAFMELHLGLGGVVDVAELDGAAAGPGEGEGHQLVESTDWAFVEVLMEGGQKRRGLGFFHEGEAGEGAGEAGSDSFSSHGLKNLQRPPKLPHDQRRRTGGRGVGRVVSADSGSTLDRDLASLADLPCTWRLP